MKNSDKSINPNAFANILKNSKKLDVQSLANEILEGNIASLSKGLTYAESSLKAHRLIANQLLSILYSKSGKSIRIGITGIPGVGKSTFIESLGLYLANQGLKVAVLAIDPSSSKTKGSILGDKTRMNDLSQHPLAFIRPSPSGGSLGGVAKKTRESIFLCEAAGFEVILIETVGVGQSETSVKSMVDFFVLLMLAGAGDELQGIKRGIMEMTDLLVVNKADGENKRAAQVAAAEYKRAMHLFPPNLNEWIPEVSTASAIENTGIDTIWEIIKKFENQQKTKGYFQNERELQNEEWFKTFFSQELEDLILEDSLIKQVYESSLENVKSLRLHPHQAVADILSQIKDRLKS